MKQVIVALAALVAFTACSDGTPSTGEGSSVAAGGPSPSNPLDCKVAALGEALSDVQTDKFGQFVTASNLACENPNVRVFRELSVKTVQGENPLTIDRVYLSTTAARPSSGFVFVEVTNPTDEILCPDFEITFLDQQDNSIDFGYGHYLKTKPESYDYRSGSDICLAPGTNAVLSDVVFVKADSISSVSLTADPNWNVGEYLPTGYQLISIAPQQSSIEVQFNLDYLNWAQYVFPFIYIQDANGYFVQQRIAGIDKARVYLQPEAHVNLREYTISGLKNGDKIYFDPDLIQIEQRGMQAEYVQTSKQ